MILINVRRNGDALSRLPHGRMSRVKRARNLKCRFVRSGMCRRMTSRSGSSSGLSPGVASVAQNGIGAAAVTHANGRLITASDPALRGETVVLYLTGLGAVSPSAPDGSAAPSNPLSRTTSVLTIYLNGVCPNSPNCNASNISYQGLAPGFAGLYQVNFQIPPTSASGSAVPLAIQTTNGFADMVEIAIQ